MDKNLQLSPHFKLGEFMCHCPLHYPKGVHAPGCHVAMISTALVRNLEVLRSKFYPSGLGIVDSYRCPWENHRVGGVSRSQHELGTAADIPGVATFAQVRALKLFTGIGYNKSDNLVVHVDMRPGNPNSPVSWTYPLNG
jgi:hypothetical protein